MAECAEEMVAEYAITGQFERVDAQSSDKATEGSMPISPEIEVMHRRLIKEREASIERLQNESSLHETSIVKRRYSGSD